MKKVEVFWLFFTECFLLNARFVVNSIQYSSSHGVTNISGINLQIWLQIVGSFLIDGMIRVGIKDEVLQTIGDGIDAQDRFPILIKDVETHVALQVNVGMVDLGAAFHLGRLMWIIVTNLESKSEFSTTVEALVRLDGHLEVQGVVGIWKFGFAGRCQKLHEVAGRWRK